MVYVNWQCFLPVWKIVCILDTLKYGCYFTNTVFLAIRQLPPLWEVTRRLQGASPTLITSTSTLVLQSSPLHTFSQVATDNLPFSEHTSSSCQAFAHAGSST